MVMKWESMGYRVIKGLLMLLTLLILLPVLVNLVDDDLHPELQTILEQMPPQIPTGENGYFAWAGIMGPESYSAHAWGERLFQEMLVSDLAVVGTNMTPTLAAWKEERVDAFGSHALPCKQATSCLQDVAKNQKSAEDALRQGRLTLSRGDETIRFLAYQEPWRPHASLNSVLPQYKHGILYRQLAAIRFALDVHQGRHKDALSHIGREIRFHLLQSQGAATLIEAMVAQANIRFCYQLLSQFMRYHPDAVNVHADEIAATLSLPSGAFMLRPAWQGEARLLVKTAFDLKFVSAESLGRNIPDALLKPFYLPKSTANLLYEGLKPVIEMEAMSGEEYRAALGAYRESAATAPDFPIHLRNPVGHILAKVASPNDSYLLKRDDLLATHGLVSLQLRILRSGIRDAESITREIDSARLIHPYSGNKPKWNAATRTIAYDGLPTRQNPSVVLWGD